MPRYVAFLRAINVGGHMVKMEHLRQVFESIGLKNVQTFIASGNVIFQSPSKSSDALEDKIETSLRKELGYEVATFLRTDTEVSRISRYKPFIESSGVKAAVYIAFLHSKPGKESEKQLLSFRSPINDFRVHNNEVYWHCKKGMMESEFSGAILEKTLGMPATLRNSTTVTRLASLLTTS
jgi:uncharacterized protein (DUF1697 family)